jgi:membrane protein implicated in regulation of membrane protease activity
MRKAWIFWVADYAAGIAAALIVLLGLLLIAAWVNVFHSYVLLGILSTVLGAVLMAVLIRAVPYVRKRADDLRQKAPDESLSGLLRELKEARTERELREKRKARRRL